MKRFCIIIGFVIALYFSIAASAFQWRNPTANQMQFWLHLESALKFERLPQFQEIKR